MSLVSSNIVAVVDMCCWNLIMRILLDILCLLDWVEVKLSSYRASIIKIIKFKFIPRSFYKNIQKIKIFNCAYDHLIVIFLSNGLMAFYLSIFSLELT